MSVASTEPQGIEQSGTSSFIGKKFRDGFVVRARSVVVWFASADGHQPTLLIGWLGLPSGRRNPPRRPLILDPRLIEWNLDVAPQSLWCKHEIDDATKLVGDEIANKVGAVARLIWSICGWPAGLSPRNDRACPSIRTISRNPIHRHLAIRGRKRTVLDCIRHEFLQHHRQPLRRCSCECD